MERHSEADGAVQSIDDHTYGNTRDTTLPKPTTDAQLQLCLERSMTYGVARV